jgi:hypothetical protein
MDFKQLIKVFGIAIFITGVFGAVSGIVGFDKFFMFPVILFLVTYIPAGILAALYNRNAPYSSAYFIGLTLSVFNMIFTIFVMGINTWVDSDCTFLSLILGAGACVLASFATVHLAHL